ncbi:MAG: 7-carboxy-7-deazaguanine synthase QueE [Candidatus Heimdallarchaeaceae archaeon]
MENKLFISEIFESVQGEGKYAGTPMLFIRLAGCNLRCPFCDTPYALKEGKEMTINEIVKIIEKTKLAYVCWTGGEPLLQKEAVKNVIKRTKQVYHHLETNGTLLERDDFFWFHFISISPKKRETAKKVYNMCIPILKDIWEIKIVTDLEKVGVNMLKFATCLMPLTTFDKRKDRKTNQKVWEYCVENNIRYSPRLQVFVYGKKKGK